VYGNQVELMEYVCSNNESLLTASFNISLKVAKAKRPFYVGEDLMFCFVGAAKEATGEAESKE
jgi:hypothetical protein